MEKVAAAQPSCAPQAKSATAYPAPARNSVSAKRSGSSLKMPPTGDFMPPSTASIPSNRLQSRRNGIIAAAISSSTIRGPSPTRAEATKQTAAIAAKTMLAMEIWFGVSPSRCNFGAARCAHPVSRAGTGRRAICSASSTACPARVPARRPFYRHCRHGMTMRMDSTVARRYRARVPHAPRSRYGNPWGRRPTASAEPLTAFLGTGTLRAITLIRKK